MKYLLDTSCLISLIKDLHNVRNAIINAGIENCGISEISLAELLYGAFKGGYESHAAEVEFVKETFSIVPIKDSLKTYGRIKAELEAKGSKIDDFDLLIGVSALDNKLTLVTHNTRHFERIPGLKLIDWEHP